VIDFSDIVQLIFYFLNLQPLLQ